MKFKDWDRRRWLNHQTVGILGLLLVLVGMLLSRAAMSIGMMVLVANAVLNTEVKNLARRFLRHPALLGIAGVFVLYAISGLYSEDTAYLVGRLRMKLPFLLLPFAILAIPRFDRVLYHRLLYGFFLLVSAGCWYSIVLYLQNPAEITQRYGQGHVLPTPVMHIRFSLMVAYSVAIGWYLYQEKFYWRYRWERPMLLAVTGLLIIYLHVLAVRSGLVALYAVLLYFLLQAMLQRRQYVLGAVAVVLIVAGGWLAVRYIPTLYNKLGYTLYTLRIFQEGKNLENLSDTHRLGSILAGIDVSREYFWTGVGVGDIRQACNRYFITHLPDLQGLGLMPHNQYIFVFASMGVVGFLFFTWATTYPVWYRQSYRNPLIVAFHLIIWSSFLVEHTVETQLGTAFYLLFLLMGIRFRDELFDNQPYETSRSRHHPE